MKVALIAPTSQLHYCMGREYQMMIPEFEHHLAYQKYYQVFGTMPNTFVMLDNGAFEGEQLSDTDLLNMAVEYHVDEVAIPDTLYDTEATLFQMHKFVATYKHPSRARRRPPRLMAIVQGRTFEECKACINGFADTRYTNYITTIGIPKHLPSTTKEDDVRINLVRWINVKYPHKWDLHFLGFVEPGEMMRGAALGVRSLDTSAPFISAAENLSIAEYVPVRQRWFSNLGPKFFHPTVTKDNIRLTDEWATYEE